MTTNKHTNINSVLGVCFLVSMIILTACTPNTSANKPFPDLKEWDLLIISDSSNWGVGQYYAKLIEADLNVKVNLHDCWKGNLPVLQTLKALQGGEKWSSYVGDKSCQRPLVDLVNEAEVMVLFGNSMGPSSPFGAEMCFSGGYAGRSNVTGFELFKEKMLTSCSQENWSEYKTNLGLLIDEIYKIREGTPIILRMTDLYIPVHSNWIESSVDEVCTACLASFSEAIRQVAEEHSVPVADTMLAFNGSDYMYDPKEAGYFKDKEHPSEIGVQIIATLLQQTGYDYAGK